MLAILAELVAVFSSRGVASARTLAQALVGIGGLMILLVIYHADAGGVGEDPSIVLLLLAVIATVPSVVALWLLKSTLWRARHTLRWTAPLLFAGGAIVLFAIGLLSALVLAVSGTIVTSVGLHSALRTLTTSSGARRCSPCSAGSPTGGRRSSAGSSERG